MKTMSVDEVIVELTKLSEAGQGHAEVRIVSLYEEHGVGTVAAYGHRPGIVQIESNEEDR